MNSKHCTGSTFSIIIVPPFMINFNHSSYFSFMELHPVIDIIVFCLYCLKIKIIFVITELIIRSAVAWPQFFPFLPSPSLICWTMLAAFGVLAWGGGGEGCLPRGVRGLVLVKFTAFISFLFFEK